MLGHHVYQAIRVVNLVRPWERVHPRARGGWLVGAGAGLAVARFPACEAAMEAGEANHLWTLEEIAGLAD